MKRIQAIRLLFPLIVPALSLAVSAIVYIKLGCVEGTGCGNVTEWHPYVSPFQQFINNWEIG